MKRICVYCGSSLGSDPIYQKAARDLGSYLALNEIELVYGGSDLGLMGVIANSVLKNNGKVTAIMPTDLHNKCAHDNESELILVDTMHARKHKMFQLSDAFIALPGGYGTLDEMFEMLTWSQLGYHKKPCGFLNVGGYYDGLLEFLDRSLCQKFIREEHRALALNDSTIEGLMQKFHSFLKQVE